MAENYSWDARIAFVVRYMYGKLPSRCSIVRDFITEMYLMNYESTSSRI